MSDFAKRLLAAGAKAKVSSNSLSVNGSSQYLTMSNASYGSFNKSKFAVSLWAKPSAINKYAVLFTKWDSTSSPSEFAVLQDGIGRVKWWGGAFGNDWQFITANTNKLTANGWNHILAYFDYANGTSNSKLRVWLNGVEETAPNTRVNPTGATTSSTLPVMIGDNAGYDGGGSACLIDEVALFSGTLPAIGSVYNAGAPVDLTGAAGLWSWTRFENDATTDSVLAAAWTNNGGASLNSDTPG